MVKSPYLLETYINVFTGKWIEYLGFYTVVWWGWRKGLEVWLEQYSTCLASTKP
jgi:hypothetical protein